MYLIHVKQWIGPGRRATDRYKVENEGKLTDESFLTNLRPVEALRRLRRYEEAYNEHYVQNAVNFTVLSITEFVAPPDYIKEIEELTRSTLIEDLKKHQEDF
jgi:hypothetical protein